MKLTLFVLAVLAVSAFGSFYEGLSTELKFTDALHNDLLKCAGDINTAVHTYGGSKQQVEANILKFLMASDEEHKKSIGAYHHFLQTGFPNCLAYLNALTVHINTLAKEPVKTWRIKQNLKTHEAVIISSVTKLLDALSNKNQTEAGKISAYIVKVAIGVIKPRTLADKFAQFRAMTGEKSTNVDDFVAKTIKAIHKELKIEESHITEEEVRNVHHSLVGLANVYYMMVEQIHTAKSQIEREEALVDAGRNLVLTLKIVEETLKPVIAPYAKYIALFTHRDSRKLNAVVAATLVHNYFLYLPEIQSELYDVNLDILLRYPEMAGKDLVDVMRILSGKYQL